MALDLFCSYTQGCTQAGLRCPLGHGCCGFASWLFQAGDGLELILKSAARVRSRTFLGGRSVGERGSGGGGWVAVLSKIW